jgi:hypothetical protein
MLTARGIDCRVLCTGVLDYEPETSVHSVLATLGLAVTRFQAALSGKRSAEVDALTVNGVRFTVLPITSSRAERSPDRAEGVDLLGRQGAKTLQDVMPGRVTSFRKARPSRIEKLQCAG